jgi:N-acetylmuramoyl-L-alanine amidase
MVLIVLAVAVLVGSVLRVSGSPTPEKRITIYSPSAEYSLSVAEHGGRDYVGLLEILEPLGRVAARTDHGRWKLRFKDVDAQFANGNPKARIRGRDLDLGAPFVLKNERGLVPIDCLAILLPRFLGQNVIFHNSARRLFIQQNGTTYWAELTKTSAAKLTLNFSTAVNPMIATEPGKVTMSFLRDPVVGSGPPTLSFDDKTISSTTFQETNGMAEITVSGSVPLLASFSNNGRTITIAPAPSANAASPAPAQTTTAPPAGPAAAGPTPQPPPVRRVAVAIDASHGGDERGAALADNLLEKDLTLTLARRLKMELENRGIPTLMVRDADVTLTPDQRASISNSAHPALYLSLHVANDGTGVRIYTSALSTAGESRGPFLSWDTAQSNYISASQRAASTLAAEIAKKVGTRTLAAPLRPLNNITNPAMAIEMAPRQPGNVADLNSPDYQQQLAGSLAIGVMTALNAMGSPR